MSMAWSIPHHERTKYDQIFDVLHPVNGLLSGEEVKPILLNSKLPVEVLGKVWELSDIDSDGFLDRDEFTVAMHLVYRALEKIPVPNQLPPEMVPISKRSMPVAVPPPLVPAMPVSGYPPHITQPAPPRAPAAVAAGSTRMVITPAERASFDEMFTKYDSDRDGYLNGTDVKDVFLQSGLPQLVLAHIWNLCDTTACGKLNKDQFALAMHLVQQKLKGMEVPMHLAPDMLPLSIQLPSLDSLSLAPLDQSTAKELDDLGKEIESLKIEKMKLEQEKSQKEADIRIQEGEISNLQKDLDGLLFTVQQLESQKVEAQKKLDELDEQKTKLQKSVAECKEKYEVDQKQIQELRNQINSKTSQNKESEMKRLRDEIAEFEEREAELKMKYSMEIGNEKKLNEQLAQLEAFIAETSTDIADLKGKVDEAVLSDISNSAASSGNVQKKNEGDFDAFSSDMSAFSRPADQKKFEMDPFRDAIAQSTEEIFQSDGTFSSDPFSNAADPFGGDPFKDAFGGDAGQQDPDFFDFPNPQAESKSGLLSDPWGANGRTQVVGLECFDPFGVSSSKNDFEHDTNDPFGTGSFLPPKLPSTSNATSSPHLPVLPPKQKRTPAPPRPPAPRPNDGSSGAFLASAFSDPFDVKPSFAAAAWTSKKDVPKQFRTEAEQLAWAKKDSEEEYERLKRIREQEEEDLRLAIALSKQEMKDE